METKEEAEAVCFICKRTAYITKCKGCIYNELKKDGRNQTATQGAEGVKGEGDTEQGKNARDS